LELQKVPNGKQNVTVGKRSPIMNNCEPAILVRLLDNLVSLADEKHHGSLIAARGGLAWFVYQTPQIPRNHVA
jgi:hypothetical protein